MDQFFIDNPEYANSGARNKNIYFNWNKLATEKHAKFEGVHNGFGANVKMTYYSKMQKTEIITSRQLQSAAGTILPKIAQITTFTFIHKNINYSSPIIKIRLQTFINSIVSLFNFDKCKTVKFRSKYSVRATDVDKCSTLISLPFLKNIIRQDLLAKLIVNPSKGRIAITFNKVFEDESDIKDLLAFLEDIDGVLAGSI